MIRRRLLSIVSALALVLSLFTLLPEGALKAQAGSVVIGINFTLTLNPNYSGGPIEMAPNVTSYTLPEPKREGYQFLGWAETSEGAAKYKAGDTVTLDKDLTLYAKWIEAKCYFSLSPDSCTLNGSGYTDIKCTLTSLVLGKINGEQTTGIVFYMNGGTLSDGNEHYIPFLVDNSWHGRAEGGKLQGNWLSSQGKTFVMSIYIDPDYYNNAVPGTYTGTFTYDSYWYAGEKELPGESGSIALKLVVPDLDAGSYTLEPTECTLNGSGYTDIECTLTSLVLGTAYNGEQTEWIGFYMNGGILSDGNGHSIPFLVDDPWHGRAEGRKYQGNDHYSQGETFVMSIYIDLDDYNNAVPGIYTGTFTYDSYWNAEVKLPGESGSIALTLVVPEIEPSYTLEPIECTLNGSGYTDIECTLTSLVVGFINDKKVNKIGFYMNGGTLSDGSGHDIPFLVDNPRHGGAKKRKYQGKEYSSQGETFKMAIYIKPNDYNNAVPGTYTGTFTYDSYWNGKDELLGESGSIALKLVVPDLDAGSYTLEPTECTLNGSGYTDIECTLTSIVLGTAYNGGQTTCIGFYMNGGTLSDGSGHGIPFLVDNENHFGAEGRKDQGNEYSSQGETFVMSIYIDPDDYNNAVPGTYTGTFTYDSFWYAGDKEPPGESGSIALKLVVPEPAERLVGDINGDGDITADDAIIAARLAAGYGDYDSRYNSDVADMNRDGSVTADDAIIIARYAAGYGNYREIYTKYI